MSVETTLYATLSADAGVRAIVSSGSPLDHRIYPQIAPDTAVLPYLTYQLITANPFNVLAGAPGGERKLVQINCIANSYSEAKTLAAAVKAAINVDVGYVQAETDDYFSSVESFRVIVDIAMIG